MMECRLYEAGGVPRRRLAARSKRDPLARTFAWIEVVCLALSLALAACESADSDSGRAPAGGVLDTYIQVDGIGRVAVRAYVPKKARYSEGAPLLVQVGAFLTSATGFSAPDPANAVGALAISYLWPGITDRDTGRASEGTFDYGGTASLVALRDVILFATGEKRNVDGRLLGDLVDVRPVTDNVGLYGFSHPGIAATNVMATHGQNLRKVRYLVGGENPTQDVLTAVELGHWGTDGKAVLNPYYTYPGTYSATDIRVDVSRVRWTQSSSCPTGCPYFDVPTGQDYVLGDRVPRAFGKRYYSVALTTALRDNRALTSTNWPADLATPEEAVAHWPIRSTPASYPVLAATASGLRVLLVFGKADHVQPATDKPHLHQAYDGLRNRAGLWVRLNPDRAYARQVDGSFGDRSPDNPANSEPGNWLAIESWAWPSDSGAARAFAEQAAVAEMADRVRAGAWANDLDNVLVSYP